jgi:hypothetical protein
MALDPSGMILLTLSLGVAHHLQPPGLINLLVAPYAVRPHVGTV